MSQYTAFGLLTGRVTAVENQIGGGGGGGGGGSYTPQSVYIDNSTTGAGLVSKISTDLNSGGTATDKIYIWAPVFSDAPSPNQVFHLDLSSLFINDNTPLRIITQFPDPDMQYTFHIKFPQSKLIDTAGALQPSVYIFVAESNETISWFSYGTVLTGPSVISQPKYILTPTLLPVVSTTLAALRH